MHAQSGTGCGCVDVTGANLPAAPPFNPFPPGGAPWKAKLRVGSVAGGLSVGNPNYPYREVYEITNWPAMKWHSSRFRYKVSGVVHPTSHSAWATHWHTIGCDVRVCRPFMKTTMTPPHPRSTQQHRRLPTCARSAPHARTTTESVVGLDLSNGGGDGFTWPRRGWIVAQVQR